MKYQEYSNTAIYPRRVEYYDLEFDRVPITRYSPCGFKYTTSFEVGMPAIPRVLLDCVFYLYLTEEDAVQGRNAGGTGFIVGVPSEKYGKKLTHLYGVSNQHVTRRDGFSVIRLNTLDGGNDVLDYDPGLWRPHPDGHDIAITNLRVNLDIHKLGYIHTGAFTTRDIIEKQDIGVGDGIFMLGRFIDFDGVQTNAPAARFGHLSMMPMPIKQSSGSRGECYCLDVHSRTGFSGSPAFVYRTPGDNFNKNGINLTDKFMYLLGVHRAQFPEIWEIENQENKITGNTAYSNAEGLKISGVSGMTSVCPAWQILEMLNQPELKEERNMKDEKYIEQMGGLPDDESAKGDPAEITGTDILRNMLNTPPETHEERKEKK